MVMRYLTNNSDPLLHVENPSQQLLICLTKIITSYPPKPDYPFSELFGSYSGPTSIAYLFLHLSRSHPSLLVDNQPPAYWCTAYLSGTRTSFHPQIPAGGIMNEAFSHAAVAAAFYQSSSAIAHLETLLPQFTTSTILDEVCLGRAGTLCLLRMVRNWLHVCPPSIGAAIEALITQILGNGPPWYEHSRQTLGAGHGEIGILTQIILSDPKYVDQLQDKLADLLSLQLESGNWAQAFDVDKNDLVQWCHGAPGFVISLVALRRYFPSLQGKMDVAIDKGRAFIWEKGLLTKMPSLCHGITGNALALEAGARREHFMAHTTDKFVREGQKKGVYDGGDGLFGAYGLGCGEAGRAWGWMVLEEGEEGGYLGYTTV